MFKAFCQLTPVLFSAIGSDNAEKMEYLRAFVRAKAATLSGTGAASIANDMLNILNDGTAAKIYDGVANDNIAYPYDLTQTGVNVFNALNNTYKDGNGKSHSFTSKTSNGINYWVEKY